MRAVIATLERKTDPFTKQDMKVFWDDAVDHIDKIWDTLDECKEIIEGLKDTNDSLYSFRTNEVIRVLTIIATIMMPLTLVASVYGMNIPLPGGVEGGSMLSFITILLVMVAAIGGMLFFFHRRHWI
jgi:magnesium transporter